MAGFCCKAMMVMLPAASGDATNCSRGCYHGLHLHRRRPRMLATVKGATCYFGPQDLLPAEVDVATLGVRRCYRADEWICYLSHPALLPAEGGFLLPGEAVFDTLGVGCCCLGRTFLLN
jgi:hypothetical protein